MIHEDAFQETTDCGHESGSLRCHALQRTLAEYIVKNGGSLAYDRYFPMGSDAGYSRTTVEVWAGSYKGATVVLESQVDTFYSPYNSSVDKKDIDTNRLEIKVSPKNIETEKIFDELKQVANSRVEQYKIVRDAVDSTVSVLHS